MPANKLRINDAVRVACGWEIRWSGLIASYNISQHSCNINAVRLLASLETVLQDPVIITVSPMFVASTHWTPN